MAIDRNKHQRRVGVERESGWGWKVPAFLGAILVIGAIIFMTSPADRVTTAANDPNRPAVTQPAPAPSPSTNPNPTR